MRFDHDSVSPAAGCGVDARAGRLSRAGLSALLLLALGTLISVPFLAHDRRERGREARLEEAVEGLESQERPLEEVPLLIRSRRTSLWSLPGFLEWRGNGRLRSRPPEPQDLPFRVMRFRPVPVEAGPDHHGVLERCLPALDPSSEAWSPSRPFPFRVVEFSTPLDEGPEES